MALTHFVFTHFVFYLPTLRIMHVKNICINHKKKDSYIAKTKQIYVRPRI